MDVLHHNAVTFYLRFFLCGSWISHQSQHILDGVNVGSRQAM